MKKLPNYNEIRIIPLGQYLIFGVKIDRNSNKFLHDYNMFRKGQDLHFEERIKSLEQEIKTEKQSLTMGKQLAAKFNSSEDKEPNFLISYVTKKLNQ